MKEGERGSQTEVKLGTPLDRLGCSDDGEWSDKCNYALIWSVLKIFSNISAMGANFVAGSWQNTFALWFPTVADVVKLWLPAPRECGGGGGAHVARKSQKVTNERGRWQEAAKCGWWQQRQQHSRIGELTHTHILTHTYTATVWQCVYDWQMVCNEMCTARQLWGCCNSCNI